MRWLRNILALMPCGKPQADYFAHLVELWQWLPERVNFTNLEFCGDRSVPTHARWFARAFPFARRAVAALGILRPRPVGELLTLDASFVPKNGHRTWGLGWFWSGMARAAHRGWRSPYWPPWTATDRETTIDAGLALLREALAAGAKAMLGARWVAGRQRLQHQDLCGGGAGPGPAHGGAAAQGHGPAFPLHRAP